MDLLDRPNGSPEPVELRPRSGGAASAEVIVHVVGEIDICTEPALTRCLAAQLQPARHLTSLVVDMSSVTYIGVQGIAALLTAATDAQHRDVAFSVAECSPQVLQLLAVIDPDHTLTVLADSGRAGRPGSSGCARTPAPLGDQEPAGEAVIRR
jgi:anti-anti-sigma factor